MYILVTNSNEMWHDKFKQSSKFPLHINYWFPPCKQPTLRDQIRSCSSNSITIYIEVYKAIVYTYIAAKFNIRRYNWRKYITLLWVTSLNCVCHLKIYIHIYNFGIVNSRDRLVLICHELCSSLIDELISLFEHRAYLV